MKDKEIDIVSLLSERSKSERIFKVVVKLIKDDLITYILENELEDKIEDIGTISYKNGVLSISYYIFDENGRYRRKNSDETISIRSKKIPLRLLSEGEPREMDDIMKEWSIVSKPLKNKMQN